jgi:hypothetical protein
MHVQKSACALLALVATISSLLIPTVMAIDSNFVIPPQKEQTITLSLQETDTLSGSFSVISNDETGINFYIIDPRNQTALRYDNVGQRRFFIIANITGNYQMHFDNSISSTSQKTIALNYDKVHYIMGMPQEQFLLIVVAVGCLIGILIFALLLPR